MALKEDAIYVELSTRIQELKGAVGPDVDDLKHDVAIIQGEIPSNASSENKLATAADIPDISSIEAVIPSGASSTNQLVTENKVCNIEVWTRTSSITLGSLISGLTLPETCFRVTIKAKYSGNQDIMFILYPQSPTDDKFFFMGQLMFRVGDSDNPHRMCTIYWSTDHYNVEFYYLGGTTGVENTNNINVSNVTAIVESY